MIFTRWPVPDSVAVGALSEQLASLGGTDTRLRSKDVLPGAEELPRMPCHCAYQPL